MSLSSWRNRSSRFSTLMVVSWSLKEVSRLTKQFAFQELSGSIVRLPRVRRDPGRNRLLFNKRGGPRSPTLLSGLLILPCLTPRMLSAWLIGGSGGLFWVADRN